MQTGKLCFPPAATGPATALGPMMEQVALPVQQLFSAAALRLYAFRINSRKEANNGVESWGPGDASGWY